MHDTEKFRVRYGETDKMGIVYHPNYYPWFEIGRTEYLRTIGLSYKEMEEQGVMLPLAETHCKYKVPAVYDDEIWVRTRVGEMTVARIRFDYEVLRSDGTLLAEGQTMHAFTNIGGRPVNIKKADPHLYEKLMEIVKNGG